MPFAANKRQTSSTSSTIGLANLNVAIGSTALLLLLIAQIINGQMNPPQTCPAANEISPCVCQVKKNGLDILCEATDVTHITRAMTALKPKSPIIFYLKLRHNNLPKLQGFIFLALDIRHLTIHNSSLAVIEETSLSSLGMLLSHSFYLLYSYEKVVVINRLGYLMLFVCFYLAMRKSWWGKKILLFCKEKTFSLSNYRPRWR